MQIKVPLGIYLNIHNNKQFRTVMDVNVYLDVMSLNCLYVA